MPRPDLPNTWNRIKAIVAENNDEVNFQDNEAVCDEILNTVKNKYEEA